MGLINKFHLNIIGFLLLFGSLDVSQASDHLNLPELSQGEWELKGTSQLKGQNSKEGGTFKWDCIQPSLLMKQQLARLEKSGCKTDPVTKVGNEYHYVVNCGAVRGSKRYTLKVEADSFIETAVKEGGQFDGAIDSLVGHRIGNCKTTAQPNVPEVHIGQ